MNSIIRTDEQIDFYALVYAMIDALSGISFDGNQICLTSRLGAHDPLHDGVGKVDSVPDEQKYVVFNEVFRNTYFDILYRRICAWSRLRIGRVRLMRLQPRSTYSIHADGNIRYHIAIQTNPGAYHWTVDEVPVHIPMDGFVYSVAADKPHTAFNTGMQDRIHLVFCTY